MVIFHKRRKVIGFLIYDYLASVNELLSYKNNNENSNVQLVFVFGFFFKISICGSKAINDNSNDDDHC